MKIKRKVLVVSIALLFVLPMTVWALPWWRCSPSYKIIGRDLHIIGDYGDNLAYDGTGVVESRGWAYVKVNPKADRGRLVLKWRDPRQSVADLVGAKSPVCVCLVQKMFMPPDHPSGVLSDGTHVRLIEDDPIAVNHFEHGSTGVGAPIITNTFTYLGTWGPAKVYINGKFFGTLAMHTMLTEGVRDEMTDQVYNSTQTGFYSPMDPDNGFVDPDEIQYHVVIRSTEEDLDNMPQFTIFWHLMFYDVTTKIRD